MQSAPSPAAAISIFRLARTFGHGWTRHMAGPYEEREERFLTLVSEGGWLAAIASVVLRMEKVEAETGYDEGLRPSLEHVSWSGRYAWNWNYDQTITISIARPSGVAVLADFDPDEGTATVEVSPLAEDRHEDYMAEILDVLGATVLWTDRPLRGETAPAPHLSVRARRDPIAFDLAAE